MLIVSCVLFSDTICGSQLDDKHFNLSKISDSYYFFLYYSPMLGKLGEILNQPGALARNQRASHRGIKLKTIDFNKYYVFSN